MPKITLTTHYGKNTKVFSIPASSDRVRKSTVDALVEKLILNKDRYLGVSVPLGIHWGFVAAALPSC